MASAIRFYLGENVPVVVAVQLRARSRFARRHGRASPQRSLSKRTCTLYDDSDFLRLATRNVEHAGIVFGQQDIHYVGDWVAHLALMHAVYTADEMQNRVEYL